MPRPDKIKVVSELKERFTEVKGILLTDFTGLNVEQISELRRQLRESSVEYKVVKNTLSKISVAELGMTAILDYLDGPTAIAFGLADPIAPAKIISEFAKKYDKPRVKAYFLDGHKFEGAQIDELAKLPDKNILRAQLVGMMGAPLSNFIFLLKNLLQQTVSVLNAIKEKQEQAV